MEGFNSIIVKTLEKKSGLENVMASEFSILQLFRIETHTGVVMDVCSGVPLNLHAVYTFFLPMDSFPLGYSRLVELVEFHFWLITAFPLTTAFKLDIENGIKFCFSV